MERSRPSFDEGIPGEPTTKPETFSELASRVLFSDSLEEKLRLTRPEFLIDDKTGNAGSFHQVEPGRPEALAFASSSSTRPPFPRTPAMIHDESRGVLLHFFANHELLAAELMALALLKFPDAPPQFRAGLANTLREEQFHTRWYISRMQQCGVTFGQYPLNRFFWDAVSSMESPLDYVSRLSLTFEQANLDYARHFSGVLEEAGDPQTAALLNRIYRDEISHVGYGLHWFRQWKDPNDSDWSAHEKQLAFPLSPSRAKGNRTVFNEEGRREAGFDDRYIRELSLFERSKGRTPNVFYFNPEAENRIAIHPKPYHPSGRILSVIENLEILVAFLARRDDVVLMRKPPSPTHLDYLASAGITLPEVETLSRDGTLRQDSLLIERKINRLRPWSRSPELPALFSKLRHLPLDEIPWAEQNRDLFSKSSQSEALREWMGPNYLVLSGDDLADGAAALAKDGWAHGILKRPFSTAGGGMRRLILSEADNFRGQTMTDQNSVEGGLLLEPAHDRVLDFSVQYLVEGGQLRRLGFIEQLIAPSGQYRGSLSFPKFCSGMDEELARFVMENVLPVYEEEGPFCQALLNWANTHAYDGPLGVDAYLYREAENKLRLRTACEINPRFTMGRVALDLRRKVAPGYGIKLELVKADDLPAEKPEFIVEGGVLTGGTVILNEIHSDTRFAALVMVAKRQEDLRFHQHLS